ncbi:uroporphyrinogen-III synthase [Bacillus sp. FJAT-29790]|uniref:uroporphyrinogen-III synthase n=1 Tax=Bacillus sp. FJAT-29790 TaxID=1895002 RepID=UPI001C2281D3|nr:uroporphyrinogen-III synthase [Bacillus sp. FJAT-29790]MBU8879585.1 uroporphyrinogen-III synthase [Bacillus sp. FJAT-29790]
MTASSLPFIGKNVLVPRGKKQAKSFSDLVASYGGNPVEIPLIAFRPVEITEEALAKIAQLHTFDWIIFTSNIAVETFLSYVNLHQQKDFPKIAAIGEKTRSCLHRFGLQVDFMPSEYVAEGFVKEFLPFVKKGMKILIPKGNLARNYIYTALSEKGSHVDELIMYETYFPEESRQLIKEKAGVLDILTFTSPSTVDHFMGEVKKNNLFHMLDNSVIGCIGPVTRAKVESYGLTVHTAPDVYTVPHMLENIIAYLEGIVIE